VNDAIELEDATQFIELLIKYIIIKIKEIRYHLGQLASVISICKYIKLEVGMISH
jgi:hypothetical protein